MKSYIDLMAEIGVSYLHQDGLNSTKKMLNKIKISPKSKILDVGCGTGGTAHYLNKKHNCEVVGIDLSKDMIKKAKDKENKKVRFLVADAKNIPFYNEQFDIIIAESVLTYIDKKEALEEFRRVLKKSGKFTSIEWTWLKNPSKEIQDKTKEVLNLPMEILTKSQWDDLHSDYFLNLYSESFKYDMGNKYLLKKLLSQKSDFFKVIYGSIINPVVRNKLKEVKVHFRDNSNLLGYGIYINEKL